MQKRPPLSIMRSVIFALVLREMRTRFGKHRLGAFWVIFEPLVHMLVLLTIYGFRRQTTPGIDFPVFLITGIIPFLLFKDIALRIMDGIEGNRGLFAYRQIKPIDTFVARVVVEVCLHGMVFVLTLAGLGWFGHDVSIHAPLEWLVLLALTAALGFGLGIFFCIVGHVLPESKIIIRILFFPLYMLSGILFPVWFLPEEILRWLMWNPMLHVVELVRSAFFANYPAADGISAEYVGVLTLILLFTGLWLYRGRRLELVAQ